MPSYQHLFSTNAVLNVWRNLRNARDYNDLLLTLHYPPGEAKKRRFGDAGGKGKNAVEEADGKGVAGTGKSIGFVVPWRSMQAQKEELREKDKELAEALVALAGEVAFTELSPSLQNMLSSNPFIPLRHLCAGLSRQLSRLELQMADNLPYSQGKNLYTGGEIARMYLPSMTALFAQDPVPHRMIFELLMELKDVVYAGMAACSKEVLEWEVDGFRTLDDLDNALLRCLNSGDASTSKNAKQIDEGTETKAADTSRKLLHSSTLSLSAHQPDAATEKHNNWLADPDEIFFHLESLTTTANALTYLPLPIPDFCAATTVQLRRMLDRRTLAAFTEAKKRRTERCAEYARCMKWAGTTWKRGGGCRRGCKDEDEDPLALPSWHSSSRRFEDGMEVVAGGAGRAN